MKTSTFRIVPLSTEIANVARRAAEDGALDHSVVTADSPRGYPCRHCLRWAQPGERLILFPFAAVASGCPYAESGPIFVHVESCARYSATHQFPAEFREGRAIRAYNSQYDMIDAHVANGEGPEGIIERFLQKPKTAFVHVRSASHGCYTMEIERV